MNPVMWVCFVIALTAILSLLTILASVILLLTLISCIQDLIGGKYEKRREERRARI